MRRTSRRGLGSTETILIVVGIAGALVLLVGVFGRRVARLTKSASEHLDGQPAAAQPDTLLGTPGALGSAAGSGGGGTTGAPASAPTGTGGGTVGNPTFGAGFDADTEKKIRESLARLPKTLQDLPLVSIDFTAGENASFNKTKTTLLLGPFVTDPNGPKGVNTVLENSTGINPGFTLDRVIFHEVLHDFQKQNEAVVSAGFPDADFKKKVQALESNPKFAAANDAIQSLEFEIDLKAQELGLGSAFAASGDGLNPDVAAKVFEKAPELKTQLQAAQRELSKVIEAGGFPSRFAGDDHSIKNTRELFAISVEIAKFDPTKFQQFRDLAADADPANDVLTPAQIQFIDDHPELLR